MAKGTVEGRSALQASAVARPGSGYGRPGTSLICRLVILLTETSAVLIDAPRYEPHPSRHLYPLRAAPRPSVPTGAASRVFCLFAPEPSLAGGCTA